MRKEREVWDIREDGERWENNMTREIWEQCQDLWWLFRDWSAQWRAFFTWVQA